MSPQQCADHRARLSIEVEIVLQGYWQAQLSAAMKGAVLADWCDDLEDWSVDQVRWALREWRTENPNKKPNPAHIVAILKDRRGRELAIPQPGKPGPDYKMTPEELEQRARFAEKTVKEVGLALGYTKGV